jgi:hypothetical protein
MIRVCVRIDEILIAAAASGAVDGVGTPCRSVPVSR